MTNQVFNSLLNCISAAKRSTEIKMLDSKPHRLEDFKPMYDKILKEELEKCLAQADIQIS